MSGNSWTDAAVEQIEGGVSQVKQQAKKAPNDIAKSVISQVTGKSSNDTGSTSTAANEAAQVKAHLQQQQAQQANTDMVRDMYAPSEAQNLNLSPRGEAGKLQNSESDHGGEQSEGQKAASEFIKEKIDEGMTPDAAQKLYSLRKQLHNEYYQKLVNYGKQHQQPEERTAEKVEKEKDEDDRMNLEEQKKKDAPIAVQMGSNRAERFPGASG